MSIQKREADEVLIQEYFYGKGCKYSRKKLYSRWKKQKKYDNITVRVVEICRKTINKLTLLHPLKPLQPLQLFFLFTI